MTKAPGRSGWGVIVGAVVVGALSSSIAAQKPAPAPPAQMKFIGTAASPISAAVLIPAGRASMWISGTTPPLLKAEAAAGARERYGDTRTQASGILKNIEAQLAAQGLTMRDVAYVRAYLVADPAKENRIDLVGWNAAYSEMFGTASNPTKTARSTVGVASLVNADFLVEIEAFAIFPGGGAQDAAAAAGP